MKMDTDEFNRLFTESTEGGKLKTKGERIEEEAVSSKMKKIKGVTLIDMKRAQNAAIALARIKLTYSEIRDKVTAFDDELFTVEQLRALHEHLPSDEEALVLRRYEGDVNLLGLAEKYMLTMLDCVGVRARLHGLIVKKQFLPRYHDVKHKFSILESACDHIKTSIRLRKVLKTILKVVNQLNESQEHGITVESLVKLATIKAFDKKTSVLQYCIMLVCRHDEDALQFPADLKHLQDAAKLGLEPLLAEKHALQQELQGSVRTLSTLREHRCSDDAPLAEIIGVLQDKLLPMCSELDKRAQTLQAKFATILQYFCEDSKLTVQEFFVPMHKFVEDFLATKAAIEKQRAAEARKLKVSSMPNMAKRRVSISRKPMS
ncbi:hypothetical protein EON64_14975 [archaeon]|nr:MAG: hypothetical protein EON64_14975 [archaeon]